MSLSPKKAMPLTAVNDIAFTYLGAGTERLVNVN